MATVRNATARQTMPTSSVSGFGFEPQIAGDAQGGDGEQCAGEREEPNDQQKTRGGARAQAFGAANRYRREPSRGQARREMHQEKRGER